MIGAAGLVFEEGLCIDFGVGNFEVDSSGKIIISNTGGSSAGEGGMGSGDSSDEKEKGELYSPDTGTKTNDEKSSNSGSGNSGNKAHEEAEKASQRSV